MSRAKIGLLVLGASMMVTVALRASDMVGVYGVVDKVVLEPADGPTQRVQVWGAFALSDQKSGSTYGPAQRGYLYYTCPQGRESICRKEWSDLKSLAGTNTGAGFGHRYEPTGRIRKAEEKPSAPDAYPIQNGIVRVESATDRGAETMQVIERIRQALKAK
jgi:hypothetical protein